MCGGLEVREDDKSIFEGTIHFFKHLNLSRFVLFWKLGGYVKVKIYETMQRGRRKSWRMRDDDWKPSENLEECLWWQILLCRWHLTLAPLYGNSVAGFISTLLDVNLQNPLNKKSANIRKRTKL